jgi:hypothetical protein
MIYRLVTMVCYYNYHNSGKYPSSSLLRSEVTLQLTVSQSVCLEIEHPCGTFDQILLPVGVAVSNLRSCFCGTPSLTRGRVCNLQCNLSMVRLAQNP